MGKEQFDQLIQQMKHQSYGKLGFYGDWSKNNEIHFPWERVLESMCNYPENVEETDQTCKLCGGKVVSLYYVSSEDSWKNLAGTAGKLQICPACMKQLDFECHIMN